MSQDQSPSSWVMALNTQLLPHALRPCVSNMAQARAKCMTITSPNFKNSLQTSTRRSTKRKPLHERAPTLYHSAERITVAKWTVKMLQKACAAPLGCLQCIGYSPLNHRAGCRSRHARRHCGLCSWQARGFGRLPVDNVVAAAFFWTQTFLQSKS